MKHKISISIDEETLLKVIEAVRLKKFQSRSHAIEECVKEVVVDGC